MSAAIEAIAPGDISYRLSIVVRRVVRVGVGALGQCRFDPGTYIYIGSARRNLRARLERHLGLRPRHPHWHIDYLLDAPGVDIDGVETFALEECVLAACSPGAIVHPGFGSSDCTRGCGSHLRYGGREG